MLPFCFDVLRSGKVHSAAGWRAVLEPVIARYRDTGKRLYSGATRPLPILRCTNFSKPSCQLHDPLTDQSGLAG